MLTNSLPEGFQDEIRTRVCIYLSFLDKLRVLFGWNLTLQVNTLCANVAGLVSTDTQVRVWRSRKQDMSQVNFDACSITDIQPIDYLRETQP